MTDETPYKLNSTASVAVSSEVFWNRNMTDCPHGVKVQLLGQGGMAVYGTYHGDSFWEAWAPVPRRHW